MGSTMDRRDRGRVRTPEDLERKYDFAAMRKKLAETGESLEEVMKIKYGNAAYRTVQSASSVTHTNHPTSNDYIPDFRFLSFWNGAYDSGGNSNLRRCANGEILGSKGGTINGNLTYQDTTIDAASVSNNLSSGQVLYPTTFDIRDKAGRILTRKEAVVDSTGNIAAYWYVRNYNTSGGQVAQKGIRMSMNKSGVITYGIDDGSKFLSAIGGLPLTGGAMTGQILTSFKNSVAVGSCQATSTTMEALVAELRRSSGCMGSFYLTASYTKNNLTVAGNGVWYNFLYIPHRSGGVNGQDSGDNTNYGTLLLFSMTADGAAWRIRVASGAIAELAKL